jgi:hypothetical protein
MSETIAASSRSSSEAVFAEKQIQTVSITGSSSFEKIVSACTGAVITMSFSKCFVFVFKNGFEMKLIINH